MGRPFFALVAVIQRQGWYPFAQFLTAMLGLAVAFLAALVAVLSTFPSGGFGWRHWLLALVPWPGVFMLFKRRYLPASLFYLATTIALLSFVFPWSGLSAVLVAAPASVAISGLVLAGMAPRGDGAFTGGN